MCRRLAFFWRSCFWILAFRFISDTRNHHRVVIFTPTKLFTSIIKKQKSSDSLTLSEHTHARAFLSFCADEHRFIFISDVVIIYTLLLFGHFSFLDRWFLFCLTNVTVRLCDANRHLVCQFIIHFRWFVQSTRINIYLHIRPQCKQTKPNGIDNYYIYASSSHRIR